MVLGNKTDLRQVNCMEVTQEEGQSWARDHGLMWMECSAKTKEGLLSAVHHVVEEMLARPSLWEVSADPVALTATTSPSSGCC